MLINYTSSINNLLHIDLNNKNIALGDNKYDATTNLLNDNITSQFRVLNNIETPILTTNEIKSTYNCNILTIGDENKIVNIINRLGINEENPSVSLDINQTDGIKIPTGTTNDRPTNVKFGTIRYNNELEQFEGYGSGDVWGSLGGTIDIDKDTFVRAEATPNADNNELEFYTSNVERMIIKSDGKIGIGTSNPEGLFHVYKDINLLKVSTTSINVNRDIIPDSNVDLNIGSTGKKFKNMFISEKGIWLGDKHHLSLYNDNFYFRKRKTNELPQIILDNGGTLSDILTFTEKTELSNVTLFEMEEYVKTLTNTNNTIEYIFRNIREDYEYESIIESWKVKNNKLFLDNNYSNIGIGTDDPKVSLDIVKTDAIRIPKGNVNDRPTNLNANDRGLIRYNSELDQFEGYGSGNAWSSLGGTIDINKDTFVRAERTPNADNNELEFYTSNVERMIIKDDGKIGINVSNPTHNLHISGTTRIEGDLIVNGVQRIIDTDTSTTEQLIITNDGTGPALKLNQIGAQSIIEIQDDSNSVFHIKDGGNIGIKNDDPKVSFSINTSDGLLIPKGTVNERPTYLEKGIIRYNSELDQFEGYGAGNAWGSLGGIKDVNQDTFVRAERTPNEDNNELEFYTSNVERMIIKSDGKVGIGISNPTEVLEINGNLKVSGIIENDYIKKTYYSKDYVDINFLSLNYILSVNKENYNSDKDESIIGWYNFDNKYILGEDHSISKNNLDLINYNTNDCNILIDKVNKINGKNSIKFENAGQYLKTSNNVLLYDYWLNNGGFSLSFWTNNIETTTKNLILFGNDIMNNFSIYYNTKLNIVVNGNDITANKNITFNLNEWNHHVISFNKNVDNSTTIYYYKNGTTSNLIEENIDFLINPNLNSKLNIGYIPSNNEDYIFYKGNLDDIRIYNKSLILEDIINIYNDIAIYFEPYTLQSLGQLTMNSNKVPIFLDEFYSGTVDFLNESNLESDSITAIPTQHSVKTYIDTESSNLYERLRLKDGSITNNLLAGDITDNKLYERYVKTSDDINMKTNTTDILQINNGGTGANNTIDARENLGLTIGKHIQEYNARLQSLSDQYGINNHIPIFEDGVNVKLIEVSSDPELTLNSCNIIPTQKSIKEYIENFINNYTTDKLKIGITTFSLDNIDTGIRYSYGNETFTITVEMDYSIIGASGTSQFTGISSDMISGLSRLLNIPTTDITITEVLLGSIKFIIKVNSTIERNSAVNIVEMSNIFVNSNINDIITNYDLNENLFSNINIELNDDLIRRSLSSNIDIVYITLYNDKLQSIDLGKYILTNYVDFSIESDPYSNIAINNITNSLEITGNYRDLTYDVVLKIKRFELENLIKFEITEIDEILDAYVESNMTIILDDNVKTINIMDKFKGPSFTEFELTQNSDFFNVVLKNEDQQIYEISGNFRNTTYDLIWSGTQTVENLVEGQENKTLFWTLTIIEMPSPPIKIFNDILDLTINNNQTLIYDLNSVFTGIDLQYSLIGNVYDSYLFNDKLYILEDQRGINYTLEIQAKNIAQTISWNVTVNEVLPSAPIILLSNMSISLDNIENYNIDIDTIFSGKYLTYDYNVIYNTELNSNIEIMNDIFITKNVYSRYHSKNFNKYNQIIPNSILNNDFNLEVLEGNVYNKIENDISYIYGDKDTVMRFKMPNVPEYSICALLKYNGTNKGTILGDDTSFIGHWNGTCGFVRIDGIGLNNITGLDDPNDWLIITYNNSLASPNNIKMYPTNQNVQSLTSNPKTFDYLYINKSKNSDWALADLIIFNDELSPEDNTTIINLFKSYQFDNNKSLQNDIELININSFFNNIDLNTETKIANVYNSNLGIDYDLTVSAINSSGTSDWVLTVNENEEINTNAKVSLSAGLFKFGLNNIFENSNITISSSISFNKNLLIDDGYLYIYPRYRNIGYLVELKDSITTSNFIIEIVESNVNSPSLINKEHYLLDLDNDYTYFSNVFDEVTNKNIIFTIDLKETDSGHNYYISGIDQTNTTFDDSITNDLYEKTITIETSNIIEFNINASSSHPFVIIKSDTNPQRIMNDTNKLQGDEITYEGNYYVNRGLINGKVLWNTDNAEIGTYYGICVNHTGMYFKINLIDDQVPFIKYDHNTNILQILNSEITTTNYEYNIFVNNYYGTSYNTLSLVKNTLTSNTIQNISDSIIIEQSETKEINLFNYKFANTYELINETTNTNITLVNNILTITNSSNGIYDLLINIDDMLYIFRITEN